MRRADRIAGAVLLAFAVAFSAGALKFYTYTGPGGPGSAFLPFWLGIVMAVLAVMLLASGLRAPGPGPEWLPRGEGRKRLLIVLGVTIALVVLLKYLGMILGTALFLAVLLRLIDRSSWPLALGVAALTAGVNWLVFSHWLRVPFPVGVLGF